MKKYICCFVAIIMLIIGGCNKSEEIYIEKNDIKSESETVKYLPKRFETPYYEYSNLMDRITETNIGLLKDPNDNIEWYTFTRAVKKQYISQANVRLEANESFDLEWFEYRIWRYRLNEKKEWDCEEVETDKAIADENEFFNSMDVIWGEDERLYCVMKYTIQSEDISSAYDKYIWYVVENDKWKKLKEIEIAEEDSQYMTNICYGVDSEGLCYIVFLDGSMQVYNSKNNTIKIVDVDDFSTVNSAIIYENKILCYDFMKNSVRVYDILSRDLQCEINVPDKLEESGVVLSVNKDGIVYLLNKMGVYKSEIEEGNFVKISKCDFVRYNEMDTTFFEKMIAMENDEFYYMTSNIKDEKLYYSVSECSIR